MDMDVETVMGRVAGISCEVVPRRCGLMSLSHPAWYPWRRLHRRELSLWGPQRPPAPMKLTRAVCMKRACHEDDPLPTPVPPRPLASLNDEGGVGYGYGYGNWERRIVGIEQCGRRDGVGHRGETVSGCSFGGFVVFTAATGDAAASATAATVPVVVGTALVLLLLAGVMVMVVMS